MIKKPTKKKVTAKSKVKKYQTGGVVPTQPAPRPSVGIPVQQASSIRAVPPQQAIPQQTAMPQRTIAPEQMNYAAPRPAPTPTQAIPQDPKTQKDIERLLNKYNLFANRRVGSKNDSNSQQMYYAAAQLRKLGVNIPLSKPKVGFAYTPTDAEMVAYRGLTPKGPPPPAPTKMAKGGVVKKTKKIKENKEVKKISSKKKKVK